MSTHHHKFIITYQHKGEPVKDWLICWTYKSALAQCWYRAKLEAQTERSEVCWGVRTVKCENEPARVKWLRENPNATPNQIYNFAPASTK